MTGQRCAACPNPRRSSLAVCALALAAVAATVSGCAVHSLDGERLPVRSAAFADYVEAVFRRQNEVATSLAFAFDEVEPGTTRYARLEQAEARLLEACRGLNQIAQGRRDDDPLGGLAALRRARQAPACEQATREAEAVLGETGRSETSRRQTSQGGSGRPLALRNSGLNSLD